MAYIVSPDPEFLDQLTTMESTSTAAADASVLTDQRQWMYPPLQGWSGDPQDIAGMNKAFTRENLNKLYRLITSDLTQTGTIGESMVAKLQIDYIAALERAFRTRHCSSVRARLHAAARRKCQGASHGPFSGGVLTWLERLIFAAHDDPFAMVPPGEAPNG